MTSAAPNGGDHRVGVARKELDNERDGVVEPVLDDQVGDRRDGLTIAHLYFDQFVAVLDHLGEDAHIALQWLASRYHLRVIPEPEAAPSTRDIEEQVLRVVGGAGRLSCQLAAALAQDGDGGREITRREALPMLEVDDEIERLAALRAELVSVVAA